MKNYFFIIAVMAAMFVSCDGSRRGQHLAFEGWNYTYIHTPTGTFIKGKAEDGRKLPKTQVFYWDGTDYIVITTKEGKFMGVETYGQLRLGPIYKEIHPMGGQSYIAINQQGTKLFSSLGEPLCNGEFLVSSTAAYKANAGGAGIPGDYYQARTRKGVFALYYNENGNDWYQYGPFEDYVPGSTGYMFKDPETGKWGVGQYGQWVDLGDKTAGGRQRMFLDEQWRFNYQRDKVLIPARYEQIININYVPTAASKDGGRRGYTQKSEIKWYVYDGKEWSAFDMDGKSIPVKSSELNLAKKLKPHQGEVRRNSIDNIVTQRIGNQEASRVLINNHADRIFL